MSLGPMEMMLLLGIALLIFGPSKLPGLGKSMGEAIRGFKKAVDGQDEPHEPPKEQISGSESDEKSAEKSAQTDKEKNKV